MWIKWRYMDHGWPDWAEAEIPDDFDGYENAREYIINTPSFNIPTWGERYMSERVYCEKIEKPSKETVQRVINNLKWKLGAMTIKLNEMEELLKKLD